MEAGCRQGVSGGAAPAQHAAASQLREQPCPGQGALPWEYETAPSFHVCSQTKNVNSTFHHHPKVIAGLK